MRGVRTLRTPKMIRLEIEPTQVSTKHLEFDSGYLSVGWLARLRVSQSRWLRTPAPWGGRLGTMRPQPISLAIPRDS
jgi:hypothetical protein